MYLNPEYCRGELLSSPAPRIACLKPCSCLAGFTVYASETRKMLSRGVAPAYGSNNVEGTETVVVNFCPTEPTEASHQACKTFPR
jgi:hypothetical protein